MGKVHEKQESLIAQLEGYLGEYYLLENEGEGKIRATFRENHQSYIIVDTSNRTVNVHSEMLICRAFGIANLLDNYGEKEPMYEVKRAYKRDEVIKSQSAIDASRAA